MQVTPDTALRRALPFVVAGIAVMAGLLVVHPYAVGVFHDDGAYAILAKSIAEGRGFHFLQLPGNPVAIHYPPAYPLVLSVIWRLMPDFPGNITAMIGVNALFLGAAALGVFQVCRGTLGWSSVAAACGALVATVSYPLLLLSGLLLSEPMFIAALILLVPVAERVRTLERWTGRRLLLLGLACGALALIRTHGLALSAAIGLVMLLGRRWREMPWFAAGVILAVLPWQLWQAAHAGMLPATLEGSYGSYMSWFLAGLGADGFLPRTVAANTAEITSLLAGRTSLMNGTFWTGLGLGSVMIALGYGGWRAQRRAPVLVWTATIYMVIVMLWPYSPWRFLFAIWPLLIILMGEAVRGAHGLARAKRPTGYALVGLLVLLTVGMASREIRAVRDRAWWTPATVAAQQTVPAMMWIVRNTAETDVVASEVPELVYLYTGRRSVPVMPFNAAEYGVARSPALDARNVAAVVHELPVTHVVTISPWLRDALRVSGVGATLRDSTATYAAFRLDRRPR